MEAFAGFVFAALYAVAVRGYLHARALRDADRWHWGAVCSSGLLGGVAFYVSLHLRNPQTPSLLDLPAFLILCLAASSVPALMEVGVVVRARLLKQAEIKAANGSGGEHEAP